jgi:hypothetical protein
MKVSVLALMTMTMAGAACGGDSATAPPASTSSGSTETFTGSLAVQGSSFYSFTVTATDTVSLSLASLTAGSIGAASASVIRIGLGVPIGTDCAVNNSVDTAAGLTTQLTASATPDVYCVKISDIGNLAAPANFTIRIGHNLSSSSSNPTAATDTFASFLAIGGSSFHTFPVSQSGAIIITLTSVTPSSMVGLGIGIPGASTSTCILSSSLTATAGSTPQITVPVDAGTYCVDVYDAGTLTAPGVSFSLTIAHP